MGTHARIEPGGFVSIDTSAWIAERTGGPDPDLTDNLRAWGAALILCDPDRKQAHDPITEARTWCLTYGYAINEPGLITHEDTRLDVRVWILRATVAENYPIAVIGLNDAEGCVYADTCLDSGYWFDADSIDIACPAAHGWTWLSGRELITSRGDFTTITRVFGTDLDAPFTACPDCEKTRSASKPRGCGCGATPWIICPTCGRRCDVELPSH